jgi:hypothetical protein
VVHVLLALTPIDPQIAIEECGPILSDDLAALCFVGLADPIPASCRGLQEIAPPGKRITENFRWKRSLRDIQIRHFCQQINQQRVFDCALLEDVRNSDDIRGPCSQRGGPLERFFALIDGPVHVTGIEKDSEGVHCHAKELPEAIESDWTGKCERLENWMCNHEPVDLTLEPLHFRVHCNVELRQLRKNRFPRFCREPVQHDVSLNVPLSGFRGSSLSPAAALLTGTTFASMNGCLTPWLNF